MTPLTYLLTFLPLDLAGVIHMIDVHMLLVGKCVIDDPDVCQEQSKNGDYDVQSVANEQ